VPSGGNATLTLTATGTNSDGSRAYLSGTKNSSTVRTSNIHRLGFGQRGGQVRDVHREREDAPE
jgi:hypothetical protein